MGSSDNNERDADFSKLEVPTNGDSSGGAAAPTNAELETVKAELADEKDKYLRALAELENFRKRALKEKSDILKYQGESILRDMLEVVDDLELAVAHAESDPTQLKKGVEMIHKKLVQVLGRWEVRSDPSVGKTFDPNRHEALSRVKSADAPAGTVLNEFKKAFFYKDRLLRPAQVVVSDGGEE